MQACPSLGGYDPHSGEKPLVLPMVVALKLHNLLRYPLHPAMEQVALASRQPSRLAAMTCWPSSHPMNTLIPPTCSLPSPCC